MSEQGTVKVLISRELMEQWASRDIEGRRLTWDWGEPDADGFHTPTITSHDDDRLGELDRAWADAEAALPEGPWMLEVGRYGAVNGDENPFTGTVISRIPDRYFASAGNTWSADDAVEASGPTPVAALHALAAKLRERRL